MAVSHVATAEQDLLELLSHRVSSPLLIEPGPSPDQLAAMFRAAFRAADHAMLRPWRFLTISGEARHALGELFVKASRAGQSDLSPEAVERLKQLPLRAPTLVALISRYQEHPKVPKIEQQLSLGAATQNLLNAAYVQGVGAMWRTGDVTYHPVTAHGLGLSESEQLLGFIYLGTPKKSDKKVQLLAVNDFVSEWLGV